MVERAISRIVPREDTIKTICSIDVIVKMHMDDRVLYSRAFSGEYSLWFGSVGYELLYATCVSISRPHLILQHVCFVTTTFHSRVVNIQLKLRVK
jgi:hypothetical protein